METLTVGTRVRLTRDVERFPYFTASAGALGTVTTAEADLFAVKLDEVIAAAEDWDNEVHWDGDLLADIAEDVEAL